jgi:hypothetical protein
MSTPSAVRRTLAAAVLALSAIPAAAHAGVDRFAAASDPEYGAAYRAADDVAGGTPSTLSPVRDDRAAAHDPEYTGAYLMRLGAEPVRPSMPESAAARAAGAADPENVAARVLR